MFYFNVFDEPEGNFLQISVDNKVIELNFFFFSDTTEVNVLVPGAGLGRLCFEIANRGYTCQGNEVSLFMLFASNFILNR